MNAAVHGQESPSVRTATQAATERDALFAELFETHRVRVFSICRHLTRTRADAEDATQEVFVALLRALPNFRGESALPTFIHRIAVRVAIKQRMRSSRQTDLRVPLPPSASVPIESELTQRRLWNCIDQLSLEQRTVIGLFAVEGLSHQEIAAILGIPEGTVWSRLHVARKRLTALLSDSP